MTTSGKRHPRKPLALWLAAGLTVSGIIACMIPLPRGLFTPSSAQSLQIEDRRGVVLRVFLNDREGRGQWRRLDRIAAPMKEAVIAAEDRRFRWHPGLDPIAIVRAAVTNIASGRIRSGGSTITQQVVKSILPSPRNVPGKVLEAWRALRLERTLSKDEILEQYLNRIPFGNQTFGVEAASRQYLGKPASDLSLAEAAFLAALPNAPGALNPYRDPAAAFARQRLVLRRMLDEGVVSRDDYDRAVVQPLRIVPESDAFRAPHAVELAVAMAESDPGTAVIQTTIDHALHTRVQEIVRSHLRELSRRNVTNAAVLVIENSTGAVRVLLGSSDFFDEKCQGQVNGVLARRQPGSALKPFTYALAFEAGMNPSDVVPDIPTFVPDKNGDYIPENYDRRFHGPVRLRTALACSYNVPAVRVLRAIGMERLWSRLPDFGFSTLTESAEYYGLGLTLGNADVTLLDLTNAYAVLARGGLRMPVRLVDRVLSADGTWMEMPAAAQVRVLDERAAFLVKDILSDPSARRPAFGNAFHLPFPCAVKTGTTKDYRDNWTVGFTARYTVGVWAGNFEGTPMRGVSGVSGAGAIFTDIMLLLHGPPTPDTESPGPAPAGVVERTVCTLSGQLPGPCCRLTMRDWFIQGREPRDGCKVHRLFLEPDRNGVPTERVFEILPPEYRDWVREQRIPQPTAKAMEVGSVPSHRKPSPLAILSPVDGDLFKIDPSLRREYQAIRILANVPPNLSDARLLVDKHEVGPLAAGGAWWDLRRGVHQLRIEARSKERTYVSRVVRIVVE